MAKSASGRTKDERLQAIRAIIRRSGRIDRKALQEAMASNLDVEAASLEDSIYRDTQDLVSRGEIKEVRHTPSGELIGDYDPETHKNTLVSWVLPDVDAPTVMGSGLLEQYGARFLTSKVLSRAFSITEEKGNILPRSFHLFFMIGPRLFHAIADVDAVPFTLLIGRSQKGEEIRFDMLEAKYGKRSAALVVPEIGVSRMVDDGHVKAHTALEFSTEHAIRVLDQGSKNGTDCAYLNRGEAEKLIHARALKSDHTATGGKTMQLSDLEWRSMTPGSSESAELPLAIRCSKDFVLLVI
jgi:hypothetical protein